ncbi:MAG: hypothetical protein DRJ15_01330 [Bacteroidetes bacterium]|nr:MAG: hypothetical protein DRJ15_01330 [Bacteroidota bacterium]
MSDKGLAGVCEGNATLKPIGGGRVRPGTGKGRGGEEQCSQELRKTKLRCRGDQTARKRNQKH